MVPRGTAPLPPPTDGPTAIRGLVDRLTSRRRPRVTLVGGAGWLNTGDDLIAQAIVDQLPSAEVTLVGGPNRPPSFRSIAGYVPLSGERVQRIRLLYRLLSSDLVLIGGGGLLDDRIDHFWRPFYRVAWICVRTRTPYALVGVGVGPLRHPPSMAAYRFIGERAVLTTVRDEASRDRLVASGVRAPIQVVNDPVLWLGPSDKPVSPSRYDLAINLRHWGHLPTDGARVSTAQIEKSLLESLHAALPQSSRIALVAMSALASDDDREAMSGLALSLRRAGHRVETIPFGLEPTRTAIAEARALIAMRLHACLLAQLSGVPVLGLAYDAKIQQQGQLQGFDTLDLPSAAQPEILTSRIAGLVAET